MGTRSGPACCGAAACPERERGARRRPVHCANPSCRYGRAREVRRALLRAVPASISAAPIAATMPMSQPVNGSPELLFPDAAAPSVPLGPEEPLLPAAWVPPWARSEEHTSELQSHVNLVCRLLLEK